MAKDLKSVFPEALEYYKEYSDIGAFFKELQHNLEKAGEKTLDPAPFLGSVFDGLARNPPKDPTLRKKLEDFLIYLQKSQTKVTKEITDLVVKHLVYKPNWPKFRDGGWIENQNKMTPLGKPVKSSLEPYPQLKKVLGK